MSNYYLPLYLAGPLQSWSTTPLYCNRYYVYTNPYPTKTGVSGLLCAALGIDRKDKANIDKIRLLPMDVLIIKPGRMLMDYHTVGAGYDKQDYSNKLYNAEGKSKGRDSIVTYRQYLEDAAFGVIVHGTKKKLQEIFNALHNPKWFLYLGRKSCPPSKPLVFDVCSSYEEAQGKIENATGVKLEAVSVIRDI